MLFAKRKLSLTTARPVLLLAVLLLIILRAIAKQQLLSMNAKTSKNIITTQRSLENKLMARPLKGLENRQKVTIRLEPSEKELLLKHFGGVQAGIDWLLEQVRPRERSLPMSRVKEDPNAKTIELREIRSKLLKYFPEYKVTHAKNGRDHIHMHNDNFAIFINEEQENFLRTLNIYYHFEQKTVVFGIDIYGYKTS
jgi:hypothetical protein